VLALVRADARIDLFEWVMHRVLLKSLKPQFEGPAHVRVRYARLTSATPHVAEVLSAIARAASTDPTTQLRAFAAGTAAMQIDATLNAADDPNFMRMNDALRELRGLAALEKPRLLKGCAACALVDGASVAQRALLIGVAATLDCPLPPDLELRPAPALGNI
jgi:hypothetical protein